MLAAQTKNKNFNEFVFLSFIFLILRLISSFSIFQFLQSFDDRIFSYTDLDFYNRADLNIFSLILFMLFVKQIGYNNIICFPLNLYPYHLLSFIVVTPFIFFRSKIFQSTLILCYFIFTSLFVSIFLENRLKYICNPWHIFL